MAPIVEKKERLLIVDDMKENIQLLGQILREANYDINVAMSGETALEILENVDIDLILLDIMMPEMNGFEVCRQLKVMQKTSDIPVIFLTAKSDTESIVESFSVGAVDYVVKPFKKLELLARVKTHLDLRRSRRELEAALAELKILRGTIPICASCKKIRDDEGFWNQVESYIQAHTDARFTHGMCPECEEKFYGGEKWYDNYKDRRRK